MAKYTLPPGEKGQFAVIPDGVYVVQVQGPKLAYARGSGAPTIECYLVVLEGQFSGERIYHQYSLQADALWRIRDDLRTTGRLSREKYPTEQSFDLEDTEMVRLLDGASGPAAIFIDTFKGSPRSKLATEGFLTPEELSKRGIVLPSRAPTTAPAAPVPKTTAAPYYPQQPSTLPEAAEPF